MKFFYLDISRNSSQVSQVHIHECSHIPPMLYRSYLGPFNNAKEALRKARERKKNVAVCPQCCENVMNSVAYFTSATLEEYEGERNSGKSVNTSRRRGLLDSTLEKVG